ncbi:MAG: signal peptidase II [Arenicella sp.]|jgi:signal peptidase II|nr:signal peptidase II [Arenicella sp.]
MTRSRGLLLIGVFVLLADQLTKYWAEHVLGRFGIVEILPVFDFSLAHNYGAAFGFLNDAGGWQTIFFTSLAVVVSAVLAFMIRSLQAHERHLALAYTLIIAGAMGNAIDRVIYGYVVDFIHFFYGAWHYPHFNVADSAIFVGGGLLIAEAFGAPFLNTGNTSLNTVNKSSDSDHLDRKKSN